MRVSRGCIDLIYSCLLVISLKMIFVLISVVDFSTKMYCRGQTEIPTKERCSFFNPFGKINMLNNRILRLVFYVGIGMCIVLLALCL